eukprot:TRINITY_DN13307_c0_g1_i1.p1 TRINITY_DN13307_c0_g1~~TRINITY_DN13307_c0_g1_i1.p1  ORF type:complete len:338 (-),score=50.45 TRINITY_DN13307_c0_g1_i1:291-1304(-)
MPQLRSDTVVDLSLDRSPEEVLEAPGIGSPPEVLEVSSDGGTDSSNFGVLPNRSRRAKHRAAVLASSRSDASRRLQDLSEKMSNSATGDGDGGRNGLRATPPGRTAYTARSTAARRSAVRARARNRTTEQQRHSIFMRSIAISERARANARAQRISRSLWSLLLCALAAAAMQPTRATAQQGRDTVRRHLKSWCCSRLQRHALQLVGCGCAQLYEHAARDRLKRTAHGAGFTLAAASGHAQQVARLFTWGEYLRPLAPRLRCPSGRRRTTMTAAAARRLCTISGAHLLRNLQRGVGGAVATMRGRLPLLLSAAASGNERCHGQVQLSHKSAAPHKCC